MKTAYLLDASAALAFLNQETGARAVEKLLTTADCYISAVNFQEVIFRLVRVGVPPKDAVEALHALDLTVVPFTGELAADARLTAASREHGLSLGDRCCLLTALHNGWVAVTAERVWEKLTGSFSGLMIHSIRK